MDGPGEPILAHPELLEELRRQHLARVDGGSAFGRRGCAALLGRHETVLE
jgi:hypothetical protein